MKQQQVGNDEMNGVTERVKGIVAGYLEMDSNSLNAQTNFREDLNFDSLSVMELVLALEEEFSVVLDDDAVSRVTTIGEAATALSAAIVSRQNSI